jgi:hypothetical protein
MMPGPTPDDLLRCLKAAGTHGEVLAEIAAAVLSADPSGPVTEQWADVLVDHLWQHDKLVEAMVIRRTFGGTLSPSLWTAELGAFAASPAFDEWLGAVNLSTLSAEGRAALLIATVIEVLSPVSAQIGENAAKVLTALCKEDATPAGLKSVLDYRSRHGQISPESFGKLASRRDRRDRTDELVADVRTCAERWRSGSIRGHDGTRVRGFLNQDNSPAMALLEIIARDLQDETSVSRLKQWWELYASFGADQLLQLVERGAGGASPLQGRGRVNYLTRVVSPLIAAVMQLLDELRSSSGGMVEVPSHLKPLIADLKSVLPDLERMYESLPAELRTATTLSMQRLRTLIAGSRG